MHTYAAPFTGPTRGRPDFTGFQGFSGPSFSPLAVKTAYFYIICSGQLLDGSWRLTQATRCLCLLRAAILGGECG